MGAIIAKVLSSRNSRHECALGYDRSRKVSGSNFSVFWRVALGSLGIVVLMAGVNLYALTQLRQITDFSTDLVSYRYPAIESAKWLLTSLYSQLVSEKKYLAVHHPGFLMDFNEEAEEFVQTLAALRNQEGSADGQRLLIETDQLYKDYRGLFRRYAERHVRTSSNPAADYERRRDVLIDQLARTLQSYIALHEAWVSTGVGAARARSDRAHAIARLLTILASFLALGLAGMASYSVLCFLRRRDERIDQPNQESAGMVMEASASNDRIEAGSASPPFAATAWRKVR